MIPCCARFLHNLNEVDAFGKFRCNYGKFIDTHIGLSYLFGHYVAKPVKNFE